MYQARLSTPATVHLIEAQIIEGLGQCKPISDIAKEIAVHLQTAQRKDHARQTAP